MTSRMTPAERQLARIIALTGSRSPNLLAMIDLLSDLGIKTRARINELRGVISMSFERDGDRVTFGLTGLRMTGRLRLSDVWHRAAFMEIEQAARDGLPQPKLLDEHFEVIGVFDPERVWQKAPSMGDHMLLNATIGNVSYGQLTPAVGADVFSGMTLDQIRAAAETAELNIGHPDLADLPEAEQLNVLRWAMRIDYAVSLDDPAADPVSMGIVRLRAVQEWMKQRPELLDWLEKKDRKMQSGLPPLSPDAAVFGAIKFGNSHAGLVISADCAELTEPRQLRAFQELVRRGYIAAEPLAGGTQSWKLTDKKPGIWRVCAILEIKLPDAEHEWARVPLLLPKTDPDAQPVISQDDVPGHGQDGRPLPDPEL